jgi:hypothetical protein
MSVFFKKNIILIGSEVLTEKVIQESGSIRMPGDYSCSNYRLLFYLLVKRCELNCADLRSNPVTDLWIDGEPSVSITTRNSLFK